MTFDTDLARHLASYDRSETNAEREREARPDDSYAAWGEDVSLVSESDLYGDSNTRMAGHLVQVDDGYPRYVGGPHEPQW